MKQKLFALMLAGLMVASLTACGKKDAPAASSSDSTAPLSATTSQEDPEALPATDATDDGHYIDYLPEGITQKLAETEPNEDLRQVIIDTYEIPEDYWEQTRYYYNYVDLNGDGENEIFAVVVGPYTSGTGGSSALWVLPYADMAVAQSFTLINAPVIITKDATNGQEFGARGIIVERAGGGAKAEWVQLTCQDGEYETVNAAQPVENFDEITGTAIICNDMVADADEGAGLTLAAK